MPPATPPAAPPPAPAAGPPRRVLVVEDDPTVAEVVTGYLSRAGYTTAHAADGFAALDRAADFRPHLVVLDLMLPGLDGLEVCRRLRRSADGPAVPVVMLTARGEEADRILGLELGADDYVTKPFSPRELVLRIGSVLRRAESAPPAAAAAAVLRAGDLSADPAGRRAARGGRELSLTTREFDLLVFLMRHPGQVFAREELLQRVWGWEFGDLSTVTVHVRRLREKIEADPAAPRLVTTVWGAGYRFDPAREEPPQGDGPLLGGDLLP
ncbi:response regulator transcription factor [Streptomyces kronopolitis]|uniref:response regulator transcription factor n=1 Tax=Streptomyces kronopolitis TaxID=1612435 RepID=UPI003674CA75